MYRVFLGLLIVSICSISSFAQEKEENEDKLPEFLEMRKPNFFKAQRRAERYFKRKNTQARIEEAIPDTFSTENVMGGREEDNEYHRFKRWEWFWRDKVNKDGSFPDPLESFAIYQKMQTETANLRTEAVNPTWQSIGMTKNDGGYWGLGRTRSIAIFPGNSQIYYVTSGGGGVWKTTNGGTTYTPVGDGLPQLFCETILVDRQDPNTVYVSVGGTVPGLGVYKSTNGGDSWTPTGFTGTIARGIYINKLVMSPTDSKVIIAVTNIGIHRTDNGGDTWKLVRTSPHNDVVFRPGDGTTVYASSGDYWSGSEIYRSTDGGLNWTQATNLGRTKTTILLGVSESDKEFVAAVFKTDGATKDVYISSNRGISFNYKSNTMKDADIFYVSQVNKNIMYGGAVNMNQSTDGGNTWTQISNWCCGNASIPEVHADFQSASHNPSNLSEIYFCNDGGIDKYNESTKKWTELSNGLVITMYYYISSAQKNSNVIIGATQDNGGNLRKSDGTWRNTVGGDATLALIDPTNDNIQYSSYIVGDGISRTDDAWETTSKDLSSILRAAGAVGGDWATQLAIDQTNTSNLVAAYQDVFRSTNRGDSWTKISTGLTGGANLQHITVAPTDGKVIYTSADDKLYRTYDSGLNWKTINSPAGSISRIVVSPTVAKTLYITVNGGNGKRIYKSANGGDTWTNMTLNFPDDVSARCIVYEKGSNEGLYLGTPIGVFYKNNTMPQWIYFGKGLPNTEVTDISICYVAKKIRVGTWGRGIWEADLYSIPVVNNTTIWHFDSDMEGWNTPIKLTPIATSSIATMTVTGADPYIFSPTNLTIDASKYKYLVVRMQNNTADNTAQIYWSTSSEPSISASKHIDFRVVPNDTRQRDYIIDLSANNMWTGTIKQLRFDPALTATKGSVLVDFIKFVGTYPAAIHAVPGIVEAENFDTGGQKNGYFDSNETNEGGQYRATEGVDIEICSEGGFNYGWTEAGEWTEFLIDVSKTTKYDVKVRTASINATAKFHLELDGEQVGASVPVPQTNDWQKFADAIVKLDLVKGKHTFRIVTEKGGYSVDKIAFSESAVTSLSSENSNTSFTTYPNPIKDRLYVTSKTVPNKIEIYNQLGQLEIENTNASSIDIAGLPNGVYLAKIKVGEETKSIKVVKE